MNKTIFLSASVPLPDRDRAFFDSADVVSIREAVKGLVLVLIESRSLLVFGGHPAITPLVSTLFRQAGLQPNKHVILYQSDFFRNRFPAQNTFFSEVVVTEDLGDRDKSLHLMRERMISDHEFDAGIFIGGMEGVLEEFRVFRRVHPAIPAIPVASTGAAAGMLWKDLPDADVDLSDEYTYPTLFRKLLKPQ